MAVYNDLSHPASTYVGPKYAYRTADGSNNNLSDPNMGKSFTPYARSVQQTHPLPKNEMPDSGLIFDTLLKREKVRAHSFLVQYWFNYNRYSSSNTQVD